MKYIVKTKPGKTLVSRTYGEFLDEYRYRVFSNVVEVREWDSRKLLDIYGMVDDSAKDSELEECLRKDKEKGLKAYFEKHDLNKPAEGQKQPKEQAGKDDAKAGKDDAKAGKDDAKAGKDDAKAGKTTDK